jgi:chitin synthase
MAVKLLVATVGVYIQLRQLDFHVSSIERTKHFSRSWEKLFKSCELLFGILLPLLVGHMRSIFDLMNEFCSSALSNPDHDPFGGYGDEALTFCTNIWIALLFVILICSMGNRPAGSKFAYLCVVIAFALLFGLALYCAGFTIWLNGT